MKNSDRFPSCVETNRNFKGMLEMVNSRAGFKSLIIKTSVLKIPLIPLNKGDFERSGSLLIKEG
jgi:hypothetical protein